MTSYAARIMTKKRKHEAIVLFTVKWREGIEKPLPIRKQKEIATTIMES